MSETGGRRQRLVLSCFECKRRKLKCDRKIPACSRCVNLGRQELCEYDPRFLNGLDIFEDDSVAQDPWIFDGQELTWSIDNLNTTPDISVARSSNVSHRSQSSSMLEAMSYGGASTLVIPAAELQPTTAASTSTTAERVTEAPGKPPIGQYRGPSHYLSTCEAFPKIRDFLSKSIKRHPILGDARWDNYVYAPSSTRSNHLSSNGEQEPLLSRIEHAMKNTLPSEPECRHLIQLYAENIAYVYNIVDMSSMWHEYKSFWQGTHRDSAWFNAILLVVISCSRCTSRVEPPSFDGDDSTARAQAARWVHTVEQWMDLRLTGDLTAAAFQLKGLILISKSVNNIEDGAPQTVLADAVSGGLHRDWEAYGVVESVSERDLRCKVWSTIADLDIARCIERGVASMGSNLFTDVGTSNPQCDGIVMGAKPSEQLQSDLALARETPNGLTTLVRLLRYRVTSLINNSSNHRPVRREQIAECRQQIYAVLPTVSSFSGMAPQTTQEKQSMGHRAVLALYLHELLLILHLPHVRRISNDNESMDDEYFRFIAVRSARTMINMYQEVSRLGLSQLALPMSVLLRAGICVTLFGVDAMSQGIYSPPKSDAADSDSIQIVQHIIEQRVVALGSGLDSLWFYSMLNFYDDDLEDPHSLPESQAGTADRIIALFSRMSLSQIDKGSGSDHNIHLSRYIFHIRQACEMLSPSRKFRAETGSSAGLAASDPIDEALYSSRSGNSLVHGLDPANWDILQETNWDLPGW